MVEPVSTGAAIVVGGWFANKLFGPSADALGKELQTYGSSRLKKIFERAETKIASTDVKPLPAGFALQFMQKASFSDEDESLTEAWATLLANASRQFDSRFTAFVDILSQMNAFDAAVLSKMVPVETPYHPTQSMPVNVRLEIKLQLAMEITATSETQTAAEDEFARLMNMKLAWPGRITAARVHYRAGDAIRPISGGVPDQFASFDNLVRLGLLSRFDLDISMAPYETGLEGVLVTMLGIGFVQTCRKSTVAFEGGNR